MAGNQQLSARPADSLDLPVLIAIYLVPDFTVVSLSSAIEALRLANSVLGYRAYDWRLISENGGLVRASCGTSLLSDSTLYAERKRLIDARRPSLALVCAENNVEKYCNRSLEAWLRDCRHRRIPVGALGAGTYVLARAGLLGNRRCSVHWEKEPGFTETFNSLNVDTGIYDIDGDIWTCAGGSAAFDMMLQMVERDFGEPTTAKICELGLVERRRMPRERQRLPLSQRHQVSNEIVIKVVGQMEKDVAEPRSIQALASNVGVSRRQVERLFRLHLGCSPVHYYRELRLQRANSLLTQTNMPIVDIAIACGFISASHFSKCFRQTNGNSPKAARINRRQSRVAGVAGPSSCETSIPGKCFDKAA